MLHEKVDYISPRRILLKKLTIVDQPHMDQEKCNLTFIIENGVYVEYDHGKSKVWKVHLT